MTAHAPAEKFRLALVGVPNCGKTALFNRLTGSRQKVANYPGVTIERKEGLFTSADGTRQYQLIDLPGTTACCRSPSMRRSPAMRSPASSGGRAHLT